ncbi:response regulator [Candidatus Poribacteria bacterium]|nr:response regulator [Candidatus Poribacteria bacterium]
MEHKSTILIVDDEPAVLNVLESLLSSQGYNLISATTGKEALEKAEEKSPDLILLDVMMPDVNGFEVCRSLRANPIIAEIPVIILTGLGDRESKLKGIESGADDFLTKPFDRTELIARVRIITRLYRYRQLENKISRLSSVYDISSTMNSTVDIDALLEFIILQTKELINVEGASILFYDNEKEELYFPTVAVEHKGVKNCLRESRFSIYSGIAGWVAREEKSALVLDAEKDERFCKDIDKNTGFITKSVLCVPLHGENGIIGVLELVNKKNGNFTEDDQILLEAMSTNISASIEKAILHRDLQRAEALLRRHNLKMKKQDRRNYCFENIVGNSPAIIELIRNSEEVSLTDTNVLIHGETGTGKELLAQAIHNSSLRAENNFVPINCGAIPENLLESELFGHEKGAFTSATSRKIGRFEEADGGTLFLDEIGDMPLNLQVKLLRVLEEGIIRPLGSNQDVIVDVRVIAATHQDLAKLVSKKEFRHDLYYRLKVFELELPPLKDRKEDIPLLIKHFIADYNEKMGKQIIGVEDDALDALYAYDYPGNIRELRNIIESTMILCKSNMINCEILPEEIRNAGLVNSDKILIAKKTKVVPRNNEELKYIKAKARKRAEEQVERIFLAELLSETQGNISEAAREAGMNRSWLAQLVSKHQLDLSRFRENTGS